MDCSTCKKHYSQGGKCTEKKKHCLFYEEEPRGRLVYTSLSFYLDNSAVTPIIKPGANVVFMDGEREVEMKIAKINWINLETMVCNVNVEYHENEQPRFEKAKKFHIVK